MCKSVLVDRRVVEDHSRCSAVKRLAQLEDLLEALMDRHTHTIPCTASVDHTDSSKSSSRNRKHILGVHLDLQGLDRNRILCIDSLRRNRNQHLPKCIPKNTRKLVLVDRRRLLEDHSRHLVVVKRLAQLEVHLPLLFHKLPAAVSLQLMLTWSSLKQNWLQTAIAVKFYGKFLKIGSSTCVECRLLWIGKAVLARILALAATQRYRSAGVW